MWAIQLCANENGCKLRKKCLQRNKRFYCLRFLSERNLFECELLQFAEYCIFGRLFIAYEKKGYSEHIWRGIITTAVNIWFTMLIHKRPLISLDIFNAFKWVYVNWIFLKKISTRSSEWNKDNHQNSQLKLFNIRHIEWIIFESITRWWKRCFRYFTCVLFFVFVQF